MGNSEREQQLAQARDSVPPLWWALYQGGLAAGFDEKQSFMLLQTFILSQNPYGIRPSDGFGPKNEE